ncbi:pilus assembly protein [Actinobacteria bacterium YIM 96077]|uniref:Pilus assembly protein n=1 Tax=Phytoactinopolyspora halophila TaxID=1981511 RepID=A0A329R3F1_9ACTN|nr:Tad domain-containing protein [Phytoactinopolyspora halophila]AYY12218.1 pilus assembly protein [Actinobacteria bacterium YIM 96077]RAW18549.1 pilus assembly protein [Phytoactinopolyspora halophila]
MRRLSTLRRDPERGAISALVIVLIVMLFAVAGLIYDGGRAINARQQAFDDAEQAARAGADRIDMELFRSQGVVQVQQAEAKQAAMNHLAGLPDRQYDEVAVSFPGESTVRVEVARTVPTGLLQMVFVNSFDVNGEATAQPEVGILGDEL